MTRGDSLGPEGKRPELYGIGGWLAFLCVTLLVLTPIGLVVDMIEVLQAHDFLLPVKALFFALDILLGGLAVSAGIALVRRRPNGLRVAKILFFINLVVWLLIGVSALLVAGAIAEGAIQSAGHVLVSAGWLIYLYKSERVRNTFSRARAEHAAEVFR